MTSKMRARVIIITVIGAMVIFWFVVSNFPSRRDHHNQAASGACINALRLLDSAKQMLALEKQLPHGAAVEPKQVEPFINRIGQSGLPTCPAGGVYTLNPIGQLPTCSIKDHVLVP